MKSRSIAVCAVLSLFATFAAAAALVSRDAAAWSYLDAAGGEKFVGDTPPAMDDRCCVKDRRPGCECWNLAKCFNEDELECNPHNEWQDLPCIGAEDYHSDYHSCQIDYAIRPINSCKITDEEPEACPTTPDPICPENFEREVRCQKEMREYFRDDATSKNIRVFVTGVLCQDRPQPVNTCSEVNN